MPASVTGLHHPATGSVQYVVACPDTGRCALIDPVLDYDPASGSLATRSADALLAHVARAGLTVDWIVDTHPHADHLSAADLLRHRTGAATATGAHVTAVQALWTRIYALPDDEAPDGTEWDRLLSDGDHLPIGALNARITHVPGHTLSSIALLVGDAAFVNDTLFMPDNGTARADFPGGDARALWHSLQRILSLPDRTRLFTGHDYPPDGRDPAWESSVARQRADNSHLALDQAGFVAMRQARDATLPIPALMLHALQVNMRAGRLPPADALGRRLLRLPLDAFPGVPWD